MIIINQSINQSPDLRKQHKDAVQSPDEIEVVVGVEKLEAEEGEDRAFDELNEFVDFRQEFHRHFDRPEQLEELAGRFVVLRREKEGRKT